MHSKRFGGAGLAGASLFGLVATLSSAQADIELLRQAGQQKPPEVSIEAIREKMDEAASANGLPPAFFSKLIHQESEYRIDAVSPKGAQGIAQFMPATAEERGLDDPFDPIQAIPASAEYLRDLRRAFGNLGLAAAAYNAGPERVARWLAGVSYLPSETRTYVSVITGRQAEEWVADPEQRARLKKGPPPRTASRRKGAQAHAEQSICQRLNASGTTCLVRDRF